MSSPRPIFLFSLPRAGSTLLQRILAAHSAVATASEPWLLLPLLEAEDLTLHVDGTDYANYLAALDDFRRSLPQGSDAYGEAVRRFALDLYSAASPPGSRYFLDKTPRYHRIAREIMVTFPDARFIFLWRQPLAIAASMMETWSMGRWNLYRFEQDLHGGLTRLAELYREKASDALAISYESLVSDTESEIRRVLVYLDLPFEPGMLKLSSSRQLAGRFGDMVGTIRYSTVNTEPLDKWRAVLGNPLRRRWARKYLDSIDDKDFSTMGYSKEEILRALDAAPLNVSHLATDLVRMSAGRYWRHFALLADTRRRRRN